MIKNNGQIIGSRGVLLPYCAPLSKCAHTRLRGATTHHALRRIQRNYAIAATLSICFYSIGMAWLIVNHII